MKQVLRHALRKLKKHSTACCKGLCQRKYKQTVKLVPREMDCKSDRSPLPPNGTQHGGQPASTEDLNRLKLLKLQENGDLS